MRHKLIAFIDEATGYCKLDWNHEASEPQIAAVIAT